MTLKIAHRGASANAPENSLLSFEHAIKANADAIELDVRLCKSGEVIVLHDASLKRMTGAKNKVIKSALSEIKSIPFKNFPQEYIPTLREVFQSFAGNISFNVEIKEANIKCYDIVYKVLKIITEFNLQEHVWLSSFNPFVIRTIKKLNPTIKVGFLYDKVKYIPALITDYYTLEAWHPHYSLVTDEFVEVAKKRSKEIYCWTVNSKEELNRLISLGIDGIITDNLSLFDNKEDI